MCDLGDVDFVGKSCKDWYDAGFHTSGTYRIDPDGPSGALAPFSVQCDMVTSGGGWTAVPYTADLTYKVQFSGGDAWRWLGRNNFV